MNKFEYTPGPWLNDYGSINNSNGDAVVMSSGPGFGSSRTWKDADNNSKLVMNSPEMFEILQELNYSVNEFDEDIDVQIDFETFKKIRAVINKIKGI